ncbi:hypothetical protein PR048_032771 [Dryococelus australis]|uniref:Uncharacterized protein n=1 Tax=Dryococelus australis TaxID=614101 RepID=A0ABQ9G791_9NEOP|nr:hypothetical protein PR048_032771 [Dryococelus australis]
MLRIPAKCGLTGSKCGCDTTETQRTWREIRETACVPLVLAGVEEAATWPSWSPDLTHLDKFVWRRLLTAVRVSSGALLKSTFQKKSLLLPAYILTDALNDMRPVKSCSFYDGQTTGSKVCKRGDRPKKGHIGEDGVWVARDFRSMRGKRNGSLNVEEKRQTQPSAARYVTSRQPLSAQEAIAPTSPFTDLDWDEPLLSVTVLRTAHSFGTLRFDREGRSDHKCFVSQFAVRWRHGQTEAIAQARVIIGRCRVLSASEGQPRRTPPPPQRKPMLVVERRGANKLDARGFEPPSQRPITLFGKRGRADEYLKRGEKGGGGRERGLAETAVRVHTTGFKNSHSPLVILLASHLGEPGSVLDGVTLGFLHVDNGAGRCRWSAGFLGDLPFPPPFHFGAAPYSTNFTLIGSQELDQSAVFGHARGEAMPSRCLLFKWPVCRALSKKRFRRLNKLFSRDSYIAGPRPLSPRRFARSNSHTRQRAKTLSYLTAMLKEGLPTTVRRGMRSSTIARNRGTLINKSQALDRHKARKSRRLVTGWDGGWGMKKGGGTTPCCLSSGARQIRRSLGKEKGVEGRRAYVTGGPVLGDSSRETSLLFRQAGRIQDSRRIRCHVAGERNLPLAVSVLMARRCSRQVRHLKTALRHSQGPCIPNFSALKAPAFLNLPHTPSYLAFFHTFEAGKRRHDKNDTAAHIKCAIATKREALNCRAVFSSLCLYRLFTLNDFSCKTTIAVFVVELERHLYCTDRYSRPSAKWRTLNQKPKTFTITSNSSRAAVAERLARLPPTKANRAQFPAGFTRFSQGGNRAGRCRWSAGFLGDLPFPRSPSFRDGQYSHQSPSSALKTSLLRAPKYLHCSV